MGGLPREASHGRAPMGDLPWEASHGRPPMRGLPLYIYKLPMVRLLRWLVGSNENHENCRFHVKKV